MSDSIRALVVEENEEGKPAASLKELSISDLLDEEVLVKVAYSTLNYKDGLAVSGIGRICRKMPMVCGIDLAGTVLESRNENWQAGDRVLVNGFGLSEVHWGGYAQKQKLKTEWLTRIPDAFSDEQAMAIGTAGYTAMLCVNALQDHGTEPDAGRILVSGASGGVGSIACLLLAKLGYEVVAASGKADAKDYLLSLGVSEVIERDELDRDAKPLEKELWAGAIDSVGSKTLATILAQTSYEGIVAACGLAGGFDLPTSVMPFILRGVTLRGIDSVMAPQTRRQRAWGDLARLIDTNDLAHVYRIEPLSNIKTLAKQLMAGEVTGRIVIDVNA
ncbi:MAG: acryloyl-CoA reductase [Gammaproteobacteria bacterium]|nr:acryloyl-CoA reductase [Gammaproteobacteria bacterium]